MSYRDQLIKSQQEELENATRLFENLCGSPSKLKNHFEKFFQFYRFGAVVADSDNILRQHLIYPETISIETSSWRGGAVEGVGVVSRHIGQIKNQHVYATANIVSYDGDV